MKLSQIASEFRLYLANRWFSAVPFHCVRLSFYRHVMGLRIGSGSSIFMDCRLECAGGIVIGNNSTVNHRCYLDGRGGITIGNSVSLSSEVIILTADHDPDTSQNLGRTAPVIIEDHVFVGTRATILKGVRLGKGAVIGAGSVVTRDVPANEIWAGQPARKIRDRKIDQYDYDCSYRRLFQ